MTGTELLTELVDERTRLLAEVERLEMENERLRLVNATPEGWAALFDGQGAELQRAYDRILDLEAKLAILCGSLAKRAVMPEDDQPAIIHHDVEPNAPR